MWDLQRVLQVDNVNNRPADSQDEDAHFVTFQSFPVRKSMKYCLLFALLFPVFLTAQFRDTLLTLDRFEVYFASGAHEPLPNADSGFTDLRTRLAADTLLRADLFAHTDAIGSNTANQALSERRARSIRDSLVRYGVPAARITQTAYGEENPTADNTTESGRASNRRVTIRLQRPQRLTPLSGTVRDPENGAGIAAEVRLSSKFYETTTQSDTTGAWTLDAPLGEVVAVEVFAEGYFFDRKMLKVLPKLPPLQLELHRFEPGAILDLEEFFFIGGRPILVQKSVPQLPRLLKTLQLNYGAHIKIVGHINQPNSPPVSKNSSEYRLSVARARTVYDYLIENGIDAARLNYKGMGNWEMRFPKAINQKQQAANRRVEIYVLDGAD